MRAACHAECEAAKAEGIEEEQDCKQSREQKEMEGTEGHTLGEGQAL